ncbi:MAG: L-serine ammonia-lyase, iron-sulfur-dependent, subunit alpha [Eubacteriales bacterium]|nr:L-serine ammonia-lyase, iron-sulfur-dependent, subunit alpha [Eubacteriales bacterium]
MERTGIKYRTYISILKEELLSATGCTDPISISYAAAKAREVLGCIPERVLIEVSGNIYKNTRSVFVPNTNHLKGIEAAVAAGIIAGKPERVLDVISEVSEEQKKEIAQYLAQNIIETRVVETGKTTDIIVTVYSYESTAKVRISDYYTNIVRIEKNNVMIFNQNVEEFEAALEADRSMLNMEDIIDFAHTVNIKDIEDMIELQIECNSAIASEGLKGNYGANVGKLLLSYNEGDIKTKALAMTAAAVDARMDGCEMPVIIVSGSGNQGITSSLPIVSYARETGADRDSLIRAVALSDLTAIYQKTGIGNLSAYCGVICAGAASSAGVAFLLGASDEVIANTVVNALAIISGMVCDGAKASCAAKAVASVEAGLLSYKMCEAGSGFQSGEGIVAEDADKTIQVVGRLGKEGMRETDRVILKLMKDKDDNSKS